jgi:hypothetical protein
VRADPVRDRTAAFFAAPLRRARREPAGLW